MSCLLCRSSLAAQALPCRIHVQLRSRSELFRGPQRFIGTVSCLISASAKGLPAAQLRRAHRQQSWVAPPPRPLRACSDRRCTQLRQRRAAGSSASGTSGSRPSQHRPRRRGLCRSAARTRPGRRREPTSQQEVFLEHLELHRELLARRVADAEERRLQDAHDDGQSQSQELTERREVREAAVSQH